MAIKPDIRKLVTFKEVIRTEGGVALDVPLIKCAVAAVFKNPYAGVYSEDLSELMEYGTYLGHYLTDMAVKAMGISAEEVHSFGKGCAVGLDGEYEHAAATLHPRLGAPMRKYLGAGKAIIPSVKKVAAAGCTMDVPLLYKDAMLIRSHYDAITVRVLDAPRTDEIMAVVAFSSGPRARARISSLKIEEIKTWNGMD
jgi:hypothetical protein